MAECCNGVDTQHPAIVSVTRLDLSKEAIDPRRTILSILSQRAVFLGKLAAEASARSIHSGLRPYPFLDRVIQMSGAPGSKSR